MTREKETLAFLAAEGEAFSEELHEANVSYFNNLRNTPFATAMALALTWSKHAKEERDFIEYAADYLDKKVSKDKDFEAQYAQRFSAESLSLALTSFRTYYNHQSALFAGLSLDDLDLQRLSRLQVTLLRKLTEGKERGDYKGLAAWLFLGPFKILLLHVRSLWSNGAIDGIVQPTGEEVKKGIQKLKRSGLRHLADFDLQWLEDGNKGLATGQNRMEAEVANCIMIHTHLVRIGQAAGSNGLHMNGALQLLGNSSISL